MSEQERIGIMKIAVNMLLVCCFALGLLAGAIIEHYNRSGLPGCFRQVTSLERMVATLRQSLVILNNNQVLRSATTANASRWAAAPRERKRENTLR